MRERPPPISEVEFDSLINGPIKQSIQTFSRLAGFASDDACVPSQYLRLVSMMYEQLDAKKIPRGAVGIDFQVDDLDIAFASLVGLGVTLPIWLNNNEIWQQLSKGLSAHWSDIRQWVLFLYRNVIVKECLDIDLRYTSKCAVLEFLGLIRDRLLVSWSKLIPTDREVMRMICDLWFIETRDPRFSSWTPKANTQRESAVFNSCFLIAHEMGNTIDWENLLSLFRGEPELVATVSLCHLDHEISRAGDFDVHCITCDLHIITVLALQPDIRLALLRQGMIKAAAEILAFAVDHEWEGDRRVLAARCMTNAIVVLRSRIEDLDALPFLLQALERGLIQSLLKSEFLLPFTEQPLARQSITLLGETLLGYTVYRSILYPVALNVDLAIAQGLDVHLSKTGDLCKAWKKLRDTVEERRRLVRRGISNGHVQTCQNDECSRVRHISRFKRCGGCLHAYYCSRRCQQYDWKNGKHKEYCTRVQQRFVGTRGQMSTVHHKDLSFLDRVILVELRKHHERLRAHPAKLTLVEINFVNGPAHVVFDSRGSGTNPFGTKCGCESFANARWKRMVEVVRGGKRQMVLVRAFIPGGLARKIVLQAIPLTVVEAGQGAPQRGQMVEKYPFNLIFTCCGSDGQVTKDVKGKR